MKLNRRYPRSIKENQSFYLSSTVLTVVTLLLYFLFNIAGNAILTFSEDFYERNKMEDAHFSTYMEIPEEGLSELADTYDVTLEEQRYINIETVIGQVVTAALAVRYLAHTKTVKFSKEDFKLKWDIAGRTLMLGICSFLSQISLVAAMAAINNMIRRYSALDVVFGQEQFAQIPMAVVGIVMKFFQIVISIVVGMAAGCIPIVGYNMGAGEKKRVKELFTKLLAAEAAVGILAFVIVEFFPAFLIGIFGAANESVYYTEFAVRAFRVYLCMVVFACVNKAAFIFLQAMGKAAASTMLSMVREIVFGVGLALLLPNFFGLDGVLYSMPVSDILTFLISASVIVFTYKQLNGKQIGQRSKTENHSLQMEK